MTAVHCAVKTEAISPHEVPSFGSPSSEVEQENVLTIGSMVRDLRHSSKETWLLLNLPATGCCSGRCTRSLPEIIKVSAVTAAYHCRTIRNQLLPPRRHGVSRRLT